MSDAASNFLEHKLLDHTLRYGTAPYTAPSTVYVALFSGTATDVKTALESGTGARTAGNWGYYEITGGAYERQSITFAAAGATTQGQIKSNATVTFDVASANYDNAAGSGATVTVMALIDEGFTPDGSTTHAGNILFYGELTASKTVNSGDQFTISSGNLSVALS
jgi:hypothetical protein